MSGQCKLHNIIGYILTFLKIGLRGPVRLRRWWGWGRRGRGLHWCLVASLPSSTQFHLENIVHIEWSSASRWCWLGFGGCRNLGLRLGLGAFVGCRGI